MKAQEKSRYLKNRLKYSKKVFPISNCDKINYQTNILPGCN